jgi:hypothetical protein
MSEVVFYDWRYDELLIVDTKTRHPWGIRDSRYTFFGNNKTFAWSMAHVWSIRLGEL